MDQMRGLVSKSAPQRRLADSNLVFTAECTSGERSTCYCVESVTFTFSLLTVVMAKSGRKTTVDPSICSFKFTAETDDRIRCLQLQQQTADNSDEEEEAELLSMTGGTGTFASHWSRLIAESSKAFAKGEHDKALTMAIESLDRERTCQALYCKGRALIGLAKYGPAEQAFRQAQSIADESFSHLIERELRHLRFNALKSMELKDNGGERWDNPIEAFRISRRETSLTDAMSRYMRLTEPKTISWNWPQDTKKMNWTQPASSPISASPSFSQEEFFRISPEPVPVIGKAIAPPPGFAAATAKNTLGPIQRPVPSAIAPPAHSVQKTAAQLLSGNTTEWKTAGTKVRTKKGAETSDLPTNVFECEGIWIGGINMKRTEDEVLEIFKRFGSIRTYRMGGSKDAKYMFISYDSQIPPAKAVKEMNGSLLRKFTVNADSPLIVRFEPSQTQRPKYSTWSLEQTRKMAHAKGECFSWRTKDGCFHQIDCPYSHQERNRAVDSCSWLTKAKK